MINSRKTLIKTLTADEEYGDLLAEAEYILNNADEFISDKAFSTKGISFDAPVKSKAFACA